MKNRKGFTITELVIVIVVIAILAAVLIPTFASLIKKANISADTQLAKNLNTALSMAEAEGNKIETFNDALTAMRENGYLVANLNPTADGCYFVWESESNQILLVDGEKNFEIIYKSKDLANATPGATWWFAVKDATTIDALKAAAGADINVFHTPENKDALLNAFQDLTNKEGAQTVIVSDNINLSKPGEIFKVNKATADVTVDLAGTTVNCAGAIDIDDYEFGKADRAFTVEAGKLVVANGTVNAGDTYGTVKASGDVQVTVDNMTLINSVKNGLNLKTTDAKAVIEVSDTTINATVGGGCEAYKGTIILKNVTINQTGYGDWCSTCVAASGGTGLVNIYSGSYNSENAVLDIFSSGGTIKIYGGSFNGQDWKSITTVEGWNALLDAAKDKATITIASDCVTITCGAW